MEPTLCSQWTRLLLLLGPHLEELYVPWLDPDVLVAAASVAASAAAGAPLGHLRGLRLDNLNASAEALCQVMRAFSGSLRRLELWFTHDKFSRPALRAALLRETARLPHLEELLLYLDSPRYLDDDDWPYTGEEVITFGGALRRLTVQVDECGLEDCHCLCEGGYFPAFCAPGLAVLEMDTALPIHLLAARFPALTEVSLGSCITCHYGVRGEAGPPLLTGALPWRALRLEGGWRDFSLVDVVAEGHLSNLTSLSAGSVFLPPDEETALAAAEGKTAPPGVVTLLLGHLPNLTSLSTSLRWWRDRENGIRSWWLSTPERTRQLLEATPLPPPCVGLVELNVAHDAELLHMYPSDPSPSPEDLTENLLRGLPQHIR